MPGFNTMKQHPNCCGFAAATSCASDVLRLDTALAAVSIFLILLLGVVF